nr:hypothetical protein [Tanacetum cinerariifolium]
ARSIETSDGLAAIQAQLNNIGREIKNVNEKVYATQVGCELCKGPYYTKIYPLKEEAIQAQLNNIGREIKNVNEKVYATQVGYVEDMDPYLDEGIGEMVVGEPFCEVSCVETRRIDGIITIHDEDESLTYQMVLPILSASSYSEEPNKSEETLHKLRTSLSIRLVNRVILPLQTLLLSSREKL